MGEEIEAVQNIPYG